MSFPVVPQTVALNTDAPAQAASAFFNAFSERFKQGRVENALRKVQQGDQEAMRELYALAPDIAMRVQDQLRQQAEAERERAARAAEGRFLVETNPGNPAVSAAVNAGADPTRLSVTQGRQARSATTSLKNWGLAHDQVSGMLGSVTDQGTFTTVKQRARQIYADAGFDTMVQYIDTLPDVYTPQLISQLQREAMESRDQLAAALHRDRFEWDRTDDQADNVRADRNVDSQIEYRSDMVDLGGQRIETTRRGQDMSADTSRRGQDMTAGTARRGQDMQSETTRRGQDIRGRGRRSGRGGLPRPKSRAEFDALPSGSRFIDPNGVERVKQ